MQLNDYIFVGTYIAAVAALLNLHIQRFLFKLKIKNDAINELIECVKGSQKIGKEYWLRESSSDELAFELKTQNQNFLVLFDMFNSKFKIDTNKTLERTFRKFVNEATDGDFEIKQRNQPDRQKATKTNQNGTIVIGNLIKAKARFKVFL
ncbi:MAG: hypothetical protein ACNYNY_06065 [Candidatus Oxydemutatoraceae bacterium WSBS_2016_MAG_OTU14]